MCTRPESKKNAREGELGEVEKRKTECVCICIYVVRMKKKGRRRNKDREKDEMVKIENERRGWASCSRTSGRRVPPHYSGGGVGPASV